MEDCIFCKIASGEIQGLRIYENDEILAFMDIAGDVDGHILVIPKKHCKNILDCDSETLSAVANTVKMVSDHLTKNCGYDGVNYIFTLSNTVWISSFAPSNIGHASIPSSRFLGII